MHAVRKLAQPADRELQLLARVLEELRRELGCIPRLRAREAEVDGEGDQALLRAVVEVALDPPPLEVGRLHDPRARLAKQFLLPAPLRDVRPTKQVAVVVPAVSGAAPSTRRSARRPWV